jgi:hypothetical protein
MFNNLKKLREIRNNAKNNLQVEKDDDGRDIIRINVRDDEAFLSPYSGSGGETISSEVAEFLDGSVKCLSLKSDVHLMVQSDVIADDEKERYTAAIRNYYRARVVDSDRVMRRNTVASIVMFFLALAVLIAYVVLELRGTGIIALELIDIVAWVFMWEAVDLFFLERGVLKNEQLRACRLYDARITFCDSI